MALTGTYSRNLDEKQRIAIPKRLRDQFGESELTSLYITPETNCSLGIYAPAAFDLLANQICGAAGNRAKARDYFRMFYARADRVDIDRQGRIRIPERLVDYANLKHDLILIGVQDHAEIWDQQQWNQFLEEHHSEFDKMASQAFD